jgi:acetyl esterase/lipase
MKVSFNAIPNLKKTHFLLRLPHMRCIGIMSLLIVGLIGWSAHSQTGDKSKDKKPAAKALDMRVPFTPLWMGDAPGAKGKEAVDIPGVYIYPAKTPNAAAVVVCPGGGYGVHAMDHEGVQIADWLNSHGLTAVVLKYRLGARYNHPIPLTDAQRALRYVRANAKDWKVDPTRVGIMGFSAGGHLASTVGTHFDRGQKDAKDAIDRESCRPDFMILMYPVITLKGKYAHNGSRINLLGKTPSAELVDSLCNETQVTKDTPPTFMVHTKEDKAVPPENSMLFYEALTKHKVPAEIRLYEKGRHGLGLALKEGDRDLPYAAWPDRCIAWMKGRGILTDKK